ncbi:MAG: ribonuclease Z [Patescibacteria group bacterium]
MGVKVVALGTGVCANGYMTCDVERHPPGFLVDVNGELILLDCSEGIRYRIQQAGYDYASVHHVAVSHSHPDHAALPQFLQAKSCRRIFGNDKPDFAHCAVYLPKVLAEGFDAVWRWHLPENDGKYWQEMTPSFMPMVHETRIEIAPNVILSSFDAFHGFGKHPAVCYRLETPFGIIAYSGDTALCDGLVQAARDADLFICEQGFRRGFIDAANYGHLTPPEIGRLCAEAKPKHVRLVHYIGTDAEADVLADIRSAGFDGDVKRANDFDVWIL